MLISKLGEFGLIERFRRKIRLDSSVVAGSGDDCAVIKFDKNNYLLFTCDMLIEGVDFKPDADPFLIGRKALAVSVSDIAACGGRPSHCLVSLGLREKSRVEYVDKLFAGMQSVARKYKINIIGGDLSRSGQLAIDVSMLGVVEKRRLVLRSGAKKGDIIFVTGSLGGSIYGKHLRFAPRVREARFLVENFRINSMIDISDGLAQDLGHILKESHVGAVIYEDLIPRGKQTRKLEDALYMGEDFELIFTLSLAQAKKFLRYKKFNFKPIGEITDKKSGLFLLDKKGREIKLEPGGYRHF